VKFLVDNQLPSALAKLLVSRGHEAQHVLDVGLGAASDTEIWKYATANSLILITKDEDFPVRASRPDATAAVVWVRLGNCRKTVLLSAFDSVLSQMLAALEAGNLIVEIR
jgi:predicted nuclease of predicted toxin-antitoxin system